ncbi:MAG: hypothetical protein AM326_10610 [Candidatus Thorarchaeota archaeon SMTZ-45]|nr:MAG: hypothetical protein AM325_01660 [Candidatus Thorarchaeota archaeon SMTZ1-45]KXH73523.1 MAG: hypothetical protein AM326_10610 [Candidatus Thorarchaeota archaeon SMTZ-45]
MAESDMREVTIHTEKDNFVPGDLVSGHVMIATDKDFSCNRIILKVRGKEYTHYQAGKVHISETHEFLHKDISICEGGEFYSGNTRFEFEFKLPENIPPVHIGFRGKIDYTIEAVIEIDRALDPKSKIQLNVKSKLPQYIPEPVPEPLPIGKETDNLQVEIPTNILRPKRGFEIRYLVMERSRIKGLRIEILRREDIICKGNKLDSKIGITEKRIPLTSNDYGRWIDETIHFDWLTMIPFAGKLIKTSLLLKVVLEVGLSIDPFVEFPLQTSGEKLRDDLRIDSTDMEFEW